MRFRNLFRKFYYFSDSDLTCKAIHAHIQNDFVPVGVFKIFYYIFRSHVQNDSGLHTKRFCPFNSFETEMRRGENSGREKRGREREKNKIFYVQYANYFQTR